MKEFFSCIDELQLKLVRNPNLKRCKLTSVSDAYNYIRKILDPDIISIQEVFIVLYLNRANNTIGYKILSIGGSAGTVVDIKILVATALLCQAHSIILCHNHPSGNILPSDSDKDLTKLIKSACSYFKIDVLDHIIIVSDSNDYFSFADQGII